MKNKFNTKWLLFTACSIFLVLLSTPTSAVIKYTITDIGTLPGGTASYAYGVNNTGQVVGEATSSSGGQRAFLWENGIMTSLWSRYATRINDSGQIVGSQYCAAVLCAVLWENGTKTNLGGLPGGDGYGYANDISDSGQVVGAARSSEGIRAFLWENGAMTELGALPGGIHSLAYGINNSGQVVGKGDSSSGPQVPFLWENGEIRELFSGSGFARDINDSGQIVGNFGLWENEVVTNLGFYALAINNSGQIVGESGGNAFLWENGTTTNLNTLIDPGLGWVLHQATDINEVGQIVGWGLIDGEY